MIILRVRETSASEGVFFTKWFNELCASLLVPWSSLKDGGRSTDNAVSGRIVKPPYAAEVVRLRWWTVREKPWETGQVSVIEMNESELSKKWRNCKVVAQKHLLQRRCNKYDGHLKLYWSYAYRYTDSVTLTQALKENMGDPERRT